MNHEDNTDFVHNLRSTANDIGQAWCREDMRLCLSLLLDHAGIACMLGLMDILWSNTIDAGAIVFQGIYPTSPCPCMKGCSITSDLASQG